jgi:hypothetical protein
MPPISREEFTKRLEKQPGILRATTLRVERCGIAVYHRSRHLGGTEFCDSIPTQWCDLRLAA